MIKQLPSVCELCEHPRKGSKCFIIEDHRLCKQHFTEVILKANERIIAYNGIPFLNIHKLVKEADESLKAEA